jgi:uncharacterized protein YvpB
MINYPSFTDYNGKTWQVVTIYITVSSMFQAEIECQTAGYQGTKTFVYSIHTGMLSQYDEKEHVYSVPDDSKALTEALEKLFSA